MQPDATHHNNLNKIILITVLLLLNNTALLPDEPDKHYRPVYCVVFGSHQTTLMDAGYNNDQKIIMATT